MAELNVDGGILGEPDKVGLDRNGLEDVLAFLKKQTLEEKLHSGVQLHIARNGQSVLNVAVGEARPGIPMKTNSVLLIFSSSKPWTAMAIGQLWEQGKIHLNQTIKSIIPEFGNGKESATVRHVLLHISGFPMTDYIWKSPPINEVFLEDIYNQKAKYAPGTQSGYHPSSGWMILGEIVRRIDGRSIEDYLDEEIFNPLGMKDTTLGITQKRIDELGDRWAHKDTKDPEFDQMINFLNRPTGVILPGGSGHTTVQDMGIFYKTLWNGGEWNGYRIIKKKTLDFFTQTHLAGVTDQTFGFPSSRGYGFFKGKSVGLVCSLNTFGHGGMRSCVNFCDPELDLIVNFHSNTMLTVDGTFNRAQAMIKVIYDACRYNF